MQPPTSHPPTVAGPLPPQTDSTGGVIPYKNASALLAYYLGVFSVIPFFPIGLAALYLGIRGLRARAENPAIRGSIHAWIGILIGGFFGLLWLVATALAVYAATV